MHGLYSTKSLHASILHICAMTLYSVVTILFVILSVWCLLSVSASTHTQPLTNLIKLSNFDI